MRAVGCVTPLYNSQEKPRAPRAHGYTPLALNPHLPIVVCYNILGVFKIMGGGLA